MGKRPLGLKPKSRSRNQRGPERALFHVTVSTGRESAILEESPTHARPWQSGASAPRRAPEKKTGFSPGGRVRWYRTRRRPPAAKADSTARDLRGPRRAALPRSCQRPERKTLQRSPRRETHYKLAHRRGRKKDARSTVEERRFSAASSAPESNRASALVVRFVGTAQEDDHRG